jgi:hypothetical protein
MLETIADIKMILCADTDEEILELLFGETN